MKSKFKVNLSVLFILSVISFCSLIYILYQINTNLVDALNIYHIAFGVHGYLLEIGYLVIIICHLYAIIVIYSHFHHFRTYGLLKTVTLILGIISLFTIGGQKVLIDEIAREYRLGMDISELYVLNITYIINLVFMSLLILLILKSFKSVDVSDAGNNLADEKIFTIAQCMGIVSGILGIFFTFTLVKLEIRLDKIWIYIPFYILFLIPYTLAVILWLSQKLKQKISEWYDEKQFQDILKSSLTTLLLSVPGLAVLLFINVPGSFYWFFYYLFLILTIFSGSTLYFFKIKDIV